MKNLIRVAVLVCALGATFALAGCDSEASSQKEGRKAILENSVNAFSLGSAPADKPNSDKTNK